MDTFKKVFWCFTQPDKVRNTSMQRVKHNPDDDYIDIGDPMLTYSDAKYCYHYGLLWLLPMSLVLTILGNTDKFGRADTKGGRFAGSVLVVIISILIIIISLSVSIGYYRYRSKVSKPPSQALDSHSAPSSPSIASLNDLFDIPRPTFLVIIAESNVYSIDRSYYGMILIFYFVYIAFNTMVTEIGYYLIDEDICFERDLLSTKMIGKCVVNQSNFGKVYIIILALSVIATSYKEVSTNCKIRLQTIKRKVLGLDKQSKIQQIDERIQFKLKQWKKSMNLSQRKGEILISMLCCIMGQVVIIGVLRNSSFHSDVPLAAKLFSLWMNIGDASMFAVCLVHIVTSIRHISFPTLIMNELSEQIDCDNIGDLIKWWELRKCYLFGIIQIHSSYISGTIFVALVGNAAAIIVFYLFYHATTQQYALLLLCFVLIVFITSVTFMVVTHAVNFHNHQLNHAQMINKEMLKLIKDKNKYKDEIVECIELDVKENSHPFNVLGVRLTSTFMLFLQSTVATITLAFIFG